MFTPWARALADLPIEIAAVRLPGRDGSREPPSADLSAIVGRLADAIAVGGSRPFALFGHSLGALIAFEVARALDARAAAAPVHLFVSGALAPQLSSDAAPLRFIDNDAAFLEAVAARYGGILKIVLEQAELRAASVPTLRADLTITETYRYQPGEPLDCPIAAYAGAADRIVTAAGLSGWREQTTAEFSCRLFEGQHFYLNRAREPLLADVTERLLRSI